MSIKKIIVLTALVIVPGLAGGCGSGNKFENPAHYGPVCDKILRCDKVYVKIARHPLVVQRSGGNVKQTCRKQLVGFARHPAYGKHTSRLLACLQTAKCETMSFNGCAEATVLKKDD